MPRGTTAKDTPSPLLRTRGGWCEAIKQRFQAWRRLPIFVVSLCSLFMTVANPAAASTPAGENVELSTGAPGVVGDATWTVTGSLLIARRSHTATLLHSGKVLIAGGSSDSNAIAVPELYDPETGTW